MVPKPLGSETTSSDHTGTRQREGGGGRRALKHTGSQRGIRLVRGRETGFPSVWEFKEHCSESKNTGRVRGQWTGKKTPWPRFSDRGQPLAATDPACHFQRVILLVGGPSSCLGCRLRLVGRRPARLLCMARPRQGLQTAAQFLPCAPPPAKRTPSPLPARGPSPIRLLSNPAPRG